jgi:transcriptional regulator with XRE-family HTH domain
MNDTLSIGQKIRFFRVKKGFAIEEFADKVKVSRQMVSKWEHGDSVPRLDTAMQIVKELDICLDDL